VSREYSKKSWTQRGLVEEEVCEAHMGLTGGVPPDTREKRSERGWLFYTTLSLDLAGRVTHNHLNGVLHQSAF
jgi:hypothetical protein